MKRLKNCMYKGKAYETIYISRCRDFYTRKIYYNVTCCCCNMNNYSSIKEVFSHIEKAKPGMKVHKAPVFNF